jgi:pre-mRNA-splicing factor 38A
MDYLVRQKIYDSRFWKEECFGLSTADVLEKAATSLSNIGGSFGANMRPTKFLCLTLKLLQLQPDFDLVREFIQQDHFKYLQALGAFYLRLTGKPQDIYELLEPLYGNYKKMKYRDINEWKLVHMDEFVDELLTKSIVCGIALPRLPGRDVLQDAGYLDDGPRPTALQNNLEEAGGPMEYLKIMVDQEQLGSRAQDGDGDGPMAITLWEKRYGPIEGLKTRKEMTGMDNATTKKRERSSDNEDSEDAPKQKKKKKDFGGSLFKKSKSDKDNGTKSKESDTPDNNAPEEGSTEYWNEQRIKLGLKPLKE